MEGLNNFKIVKLVFFYLSKEVKCLVITLTFVCNLRSEFCVVMFVMDSAYKDCSVCLYLQLFVGDLLSYLRYLCLFAYSGVQHILCSDFVLFFFILLPVSLDCPFLLANSAFSNVYLNDLFLRYQKKCDELEVLRGAFESQKKYEIKNKEDIIGWLEGKLNRSGMYNVD